MRTRAVLLRVGLALAVSGCASGGVPPEVLQQWVGRPVAALEKEWGPATRDVRDGELKILVYEEIRRGTGAASFGDQEGPNIRGSQEATSLQMYVPPTVYVRSYLFWVDAAGRIVHSTVRTP